MSRHLRRIDRYDIVYQIASGGMASVHVGHLSGPAGFEKLVAIKVIHPHLAEERALIDMFLDEARLSARLQHPNVGEVLEVGDQEGLYYMVSELILGQNLKDVAERAGQSGRPLTQYHFAHIMHDVARGLHAAHQLTDSDGKPLNLVHRDVSPRNILVSYQGQVKLIDFGVAWAKNKISRTVAGAVKGTTAYLAPELIRGKPPDPRSDIFSAGVVLYELVTGVHPFPADSEPQRLHAILTEEVVPPAIHYPGIDPELENVIMRALSRNTQERFESAQRLCDSLASVCEKSGVRLGNSALGGFLQDLFVEEIADHEDQLRLFKAGVGRKERVTCDLHAARSFGSGRSLREDALIPSFDSEMPKEPTINARKANSRTGASTRQAKSSLPRSSLLFTAIVAAALLGGVFLFYSKGETRNDTQDNTHTSRAAVASSPKQPKAPDGNTDAHDIENEKVAGTGTADDAPSAIRLTFDVSPSQASVFIDGGTEVAVEEEHQLPADGESHVITVTAPGHEIYETEITADEDRHLTISLEPEKPPAKKRHRKKHRAQRLRKRHGKTESKKKADLLNNPYN